MKKLFLIILTLCIALTLAACGGNSPAESPTEPPATEPAPTEPSVPETPATGLPASEGLAFDVYDTYCEVSGIGTCKDSDVVIPTMYKGLPVTTIGSGAFFGCYSLTSVTIPDSVTTIGESAFECCDSLTGVTIGDGVTTIGYYAFLECTSLTNVTIGDSVTTIGSGAFFGCYSLTSVIIPDGVTIIDLYTFMECRSLTSVTIPDSVIAIGSNAFNGCTSLTSVTIPDSVTNIVGNVFYGCDSLTSIRVDEKNPAYCSDSMGVLFNKEQTKLVCAPGGYKGAYTIPDSVTTIGERAFSDCDSLTGVTIGDGVTNIGNSAFASCDSLTGIWVDERNPNYSSDKNGVLFNKEQTELIRAPGGYKGAYTIPDSVTTIGSSAFCGCDSLTYNTYDNGKYLGNSSNPYIVLISYRSRDITSCEILPNTRIIYSYAFDCDSLTDITIPDSVTAIGEYAFGYCENLTSITFQGTIAQWNDIDFVDVEYGGPNTPWAKVICSDGTTSMRK